jgi:hypothetical protein
MEFRMTRAKGLLVLWTCGLLLAAGCSGSVKKVPVAGKLMLGNQPLTTGRVAFMPDFSKGNDAHVACVGRVNAQGEYELYTTAAKASENGKGAPPGWYKVTVMNLPGKNDLDGKVNPIFFDENKTPLSVEVVPDASAGRYDFDLSKR